MQATRTTHDNGKMQWYWIGTKNVWNENNVWKRYDLSIQNGIDNCIKITWIKLDSASLNNGLKCRKPVFMDNQSCWGFAKLVEGFSWGFGIKIA